MRNLALQKTTTLQQQRFSNMGLVNLRFANADGTVSLICTACENLLKLKAGRFNRLTQAPA